MSKDVGIVPNLSTIVPKTSRRLGVPNGGCSISRGWGPIVDQKVGVFQKIGNDCAKHCVCRRGSHLSNSGGSGAGGVGAGRKNAQPVGAGRGAARLPDRRGPVRRCGITTGRRGRIRGRRYPRSPRVSRVSASSVLLLLRAAAWSRRRSWPSGPLPSS